MAAPSRFELPPLRLPRWLAVTTLALAVAVVAGDAYLNARESPLRQAVSVTITTAGAVAYAYLIGLNRGRTDER